MNAHDHGEAGEELRLLVLALLDRFEPGARAVLAGLRVEAEEAAAARSSVGSADAEAGNGTAPAACRWCPVCAAIALVRGDRPELAGRIAEHVEGLLSALRDVVTKAEPAQHESAQHGPAQHESAQHEPAQPRGDGAPHAPRVQRIEVTRVDGGC